MKRTFLNLKTLLVAVGLCAGVGSAWADLTEGTTTTVNFNDQTTPFVIYDGNRLSVSYALQEGSETDYYANYSCENRNALPFASYDFSSAVSKSVKVVVSFDYNIPVGISNSAYISIADKDIHNSTDGGYNISSRNSTWGNNGVILAIGNIRTSGSNYPAVNGVNKNSSLSFNTWYTATVTVDLSTQTVSYTIKAKGSDTTLDSGTDMAYWNTGEGTTANACNQIDISMANTGSIYIDNISITPYTDESEKYAGYTIKYMYGETELKDAVTDRDEVKVGETATLIPADKAAIWFEDQKYIYESDDADVQTIEEDGSTVVTVTFREAGTYSYTLNAIDGENTVLKTFGTASDAVEGETYYVRGAKAFYKDDVLYSTEQSGGFEASFNEAATKTITYSVNNDWAYYAEAEDLTLDGSWAANGAYPSFYSNGVAKTLATGAKVYTETLSGGTYTVTAWARNNDKSSEYSLTLYVRDGEGTETSLGKTLSWTSGQRMEKSVEGVEIPDGYSLVFKNDAGSNSKLEFDYIYLVQTVPATIGATGYTTFASTYPLNLSSLPTGLAAYYVSAVTSSEATLTAATGTVAAGEGLILAGTAGESYNIPVAASGTAITGNKLEGCATATEANANDYVLANNNGEAEFQYLTAAMTVPAGKAYLPATSFNTKSRLAIVFADDVTGIEAIEATSAVNDDVIYNLAGQRVAAPTKGIFIKNGKKFIVR